jgi:hypothetical protein
LKIILNFAISKCVPLPIQDRFKNKHENYI